MMTYEISLTSAQQDDGKIDLLRLAQLAQAISDIARGALQIRLQGFSNDRGRIPERIGNALRINLSDLKPGKPTPKKNIDKANHKKSTTILELECEPLGENLQGQQGDMFRPDILTELPAQTPMGLVIESFREALNYKEDSNQLDKALLRRLKVFEKIFTSDEELVTISNRGSVPEIKLQKSDFKKIQVLEESIPEPQDVIINGVVDELKFSKSRIMIATKEGAVNGILNEDLMPGDISKYWGRYLTVKGTAHYLPGGKMSFLLIEKIYEPTEADKYFSKQSKKETVEQQIQRQQKGFKNRNLLSEIIGEWPGDESINDIINALD